MTLTASRATRENVFAPDAQKRVEFAVDTDVNVLPGVGTDEMQPFHSGLRVVDGLDRIGLRRPCFPGVTKIGIVDQTWITVR